MNKIIFISFADKKYIPTLERIKKEATKSLFFTDIKVLTEKDLDKEYRRKYKSRFKLKGFGYWMWKSYIIKNEINNLNDEDIIIYADAGCTINLLGKQRFNEYINFVKQSLSGILVFSQENLLEKYYTKADLFEYTNTIHDKRITDTAQIWAGAFIIRKCKSSIDFINKWESLCHNHFNLITDDVSLIHNFEGFVTHRHDQSAFSVLVKQYAPFILSATETYTSHNFQVDLKDCPIWATRKRKYTWIYLKKHGIKVRINKILNFFR